MAGKITLRELLAGAGLAGAGAAEAGARGTHGATDNVAISGLAYHSDRVQPGNLFFCLTGQTHDGHDFAGLAQSQGAAAVVCERSLDLGIPEIQVACSRKALAKVSAAFHGWPSKDITVVGVTGTNGKTGTVAMLAEIIRTAGQAVQTIGTLGNSNAGGPDSAAGDTPDPTTSLTTPQSLDLQRQLHQAKQQNQAVVMEVSSHALVQHRIDSIEFDVCGFTNLSPEHLDYHQDMEHYFKAKQSLFTPEHTLRAAICVDDEYGQRLLDGLPQQIQATACSLRDVDIGDESLLGSQIGLLGQDIWLPVPSRFAVANANLAASLARQLGFDGQAIKSGLEQVAPIAGRFEVVCRQPVSVVVDYAHTPQALEQALVSCRRLAAGGKVRVVFGCGGERDISKRPEMGRIAAQLADYVCLTDDNPRGEDPKSIIAQIMSGIKGAGGRPQRAELEPQIEPQIEPDRRRAIGLTLKSASPGDLVLVAGKGHEQVHITSTGAEPFDDRQVARELAQEIFTEALA